MVLPPDGPCKHLLGIPLSLPMGWSLSPSYFCAFTQTCTDLANDLHTTTQVRDFHFATLHQPDLPLHSTFHAQTVWPYNPSPSETPLVYNSVFLDDFMVLAQAHQGRCAPQIPCYSTLAWSSKTQKRLCSMPFYPPSPKRRHHF